MTPREAIQALDAIDAGDPEGAHEDADNILLEYVRCLAPEVARAYDRVAERAERAERAEWRSGLVSDARLRPIEELVGIAQKACFPHEYDAVTGPLGTRGVCVHCGAIA